VGWCEGYVLAAREHTSPGGSGHKNRDSILLPQGRRKVNASV